MGWKKKNRFIFGGAATAMALVLVAGLSMTQLNDALQRFDAGKGVNTQHAALQSVAFDEEHSALTSTGIKSVFIDDDKTTLQYLDAIEEKNEVNLEYATPLSESVTPASVAAQKSQHALQQSGRLEKYIPSTTPIPEKEPMPGRLARAEEIQENHTQRYITPLQNIGDLRDKSRDRFEKTIPNPFKQVFAEPVSTFSSDVDTASYSFVRKSLNNGRLPSPDSVRIEEMVNYFDYDYPLPENKAEPFKPTVTVVDSPWTEGRKLMHIGIKGYDVPKTSMRSNLVFLLDVSGSMNQADKLPLLKSSMKMLLDSLHPDDTISIVTYAGHTGVVLEPTKVENRSPIINALENLHAGGGTAGAAGIALAYDMAERHFNEKAVNRVILSTDGDFNVGMTDRDELKSYIEKKREKGIFLSILGFGQGNYNDALMQALAQNGNGIAAYIDNLNEARKVLVDEATSSLFPIAKDVKFQVEFNPQTVAEYRLIGYETRALNREDFNNDKIDAGDIGAGHSVTAIYEFVPVGSNAVTVDPLRYGQKNVQHEFLSQADCQTAKQNTCLRVACGTQECMETKGDVWISSKMKLAKPSDEYAYLKIRYKLPMESKSKLISAPVTFRSDDHSYCPEGNTCKMRPISRDVRFSTAVAAFGELLKGGQYTGDFSYDDVIALAQQGKGADEFGYRAEFINLVRLAKTLSR